VQRFVQLMISRFWLGENLRLRERRGMRLLFSLWAFAVSLSAAEIHTIVGTGTKGFSGDGGPAAKAQINNPFGIARGPDGALYICDMDNHRIRKVAPNGTISTVAGTGERGWSGDGGPALQAKLNEPYEVRFDAAGNIYWVERMSHTVRRLDAKSGTIATVAGSGAAGFGGDGGPATAAKLNQPHSIAFDKAGELYICDILNHRVRKVDMKSGVISTFAGTGEKKTAPDGSKFGGSPLFGPRAMDFDSQGSMWLALREGNALYRLDLASGTLHHVAGSGGKPGFAGNGGPAKTAVLGGPKGVSIAADGRVYFADTETHSIRYYDAKKDSVELLAGTGGKGDGPEPNPRECKMGRPHGVFVDTDGSVLIGDSDAHRVRQVK
jgi:streptogramin lyase